MLGAVVFPVWGTTVGVAQMVRGVINTPEALAEERNGKKWDAKLRQWVEYNLEDVAAQIPVCPVARGGPRPLLGTSMDCSRGAGGVDEVPARHTH